MILLNRFLIKIRKIHMNRTAACGASANVPEEGLFVAVTVEAGAAEVEAKEIFCTSERVTTIGPTVVDCRQLSDAYFLTQVKF